MGGRPCPHALSRGSVRPATDLRVARLRGRAIDFLEKWPSPALKRAGTEPGLPVHFGPSF